MHARLSSLLEGGRQHLGREFAYLVVQLECRDTRAGPCDLEIHVAQVILLAEDIGEHHRRPLFLYESHGDPCNRGANGDPGIHQGQRSATDSRHGG